MSLYIDPRNQKVLWEMIHKNPIISTIFPSNTFSQREEKELWFKNIISKFYTTLPPNITKSLLLDINKETLTIMNKDLYQKQNIIKNASTKQQNTTEPIYSRNIISENRIDTLNRDFSERQKEYEKMSQKPSMPDVSFEETKDDGVIKNMDELLQKQLRQREEDMNNITKIFQQQNAKNGENHMIAGKPPILSIQEEIKMNSSDIIYSEEPIKKRVSWNIDIEENKLSQNIPIKIKELSQQVSMLMEFLEKKIPDFQKEYEIFSTRKIVGEILEEEIERII